MRLRKALEKARKERGEQLVRLQEHRPSAAETTDWQPPVYHQSRHVEIDPERLIDNRGIALQSEDSAADDYKVLRTHIFRMTRTQNRRAIMVTSPRSGDGKTLTAVNLAITFAKEHRQTVLLVDADLKKPSVHRVMGFDSGLGLADHLLQGTPLHEIMVWPGIEKMCVVSGGHPVVESTELLASPTMGALVEEMKARYADRYVLFDAPPILDGADAIAFAQLVDCVLLVVRAGVTPYEEIGKAVESIPPDKFLGFVFNRQ
jgi:non-specific protein-tyrosine kinase